jgi:hypothetical protein
MNEFKIVANEYLSTNIRAFYGVAYVRMGNPGNPDYINTLKNTYNNFAGNILSYAAQELKNVLLEAFPLVLQSLKLETITVCVVPRAKAEYSYHANQLLFKSTTRAVVSQLTGFVDGTNYIHRHTNTKTTHLRRPIPNYNNDGSEPYPGITTQTCDISDNVKGKNILLIDDIYTSTVNVDEDAIQSLINGGAHSVTFYAVGKTEGRN